MPKGYQISQDTQPICTGGFIDIVVDNIHKKNKFNTNSYEEDAVKNNHELDADFSLIDLNRAGIPLLEIVFRPT